MSKYIIGSFILLFVLSTSIAKAFVSPVKWKVDQRIEDDHSVTIIATAEIEKGWHLYGTAIPQGGPVATSLKVTSSTLIIAEKPVIEKSASTTQYDSTFQMEVSYFSNSAILEKNITLNPGESTLKVDIEFMACNDSECTPPDTQSFDLTVKVPQTEKASNYLSIFILAFLGGLAALLTPCVFPMIPMTVSYFTKQSKTKSAGIINAAKYGVAIILLYVLLGTGVTAIFGAESLNLMATNPWFNFSFFIILVVFAISFLGAFDIVLPSKWANAADKKADKGGIIGILFMALTLAIVSFSCTGPIVGTLIVEAARNGGMAPVIGMLGFSTAIALPFTFFAAFPGYLNSLPKSGGWLNSVKVVLGFLELALAFKFLSMADMVLDLHLLTREVFMAIWVTIFGALGFYLLGKLKLPHDAPIERIPVSRLLLGIITLAFTLYMLPGIWGAPVKLISGFPPPREYSEAGVPQLPTSSASNQTASIIPNTHLGAQGFSAFDDYTVALKYAKEVNKPLLLDFTGAACVNCRKMEENVWSDPEIHKIIANEYVLVSLYVDLRKELPEEEQYTSTYSGKKVITVGNKWSDFQISRFGKNSQPYYVILDHQENQLVPSRAYNLSIPEYKAWLVEGIKNFKSKNN